MRDLTGKPDIVFGPRRKVIFVHGCFWHGHEAAACLDGRVPKSNAGYWAPKLTRNKQRDAAHIQELERLGWKVLVIWECELGASKQLARRIRSFLR
jgi:DNA mismatch endonuclease (patch repair protein)